MPSERLEFTGDSIDAVFEQMKQAGATAVTYKVQIYDGDKAVGMAIRPDYNGALLGALKESGVNVQEVDISEYRTQISVTATRPSVETSRPAAAGPRESRTAQYTNMF